MLVMAGVSDHAVIAMTRDKLIRGKIGQTKVKRYWPGKAPEWGGDELDEDGDIEMFGTMALDNTTFPATREDDSDPRLRRLAESRIDNNREKEIRLADHRRIRQAAETVSTIEDEEENRSKRRQERLDLEEEDEDAFEEWRRGRIREKLLRRQQELEASVILSEEEEESEYETDLDDDQSGPALVKPVFVPKAERSDTIAEHERLEAEELTIEEAMKRRMAERKVETKKIVMEEIKKEEDIQKNLDLQEADITDVDADNKLNETGEYKAWRVREVVRIRRDREYREAIVRKKEEVERVRNMTEEERREWERRNPRPRSRPKQKYWRFMQKYYHKGAFFQDDADDRSGTAGMADVYKRDFAAPTGDDKLNKTILPKVMRVKRFGRSGRTKWTHLLNEDTTNFL